MSEATLITTRACPRCKGSGKVPERSLGHLRSVAASESWAKPFHGKIVRVEGEHRRLKPFFGVAIAKSSYGGYWVVRVYTPEQVWTDRELSDKGYVYPVTRRESYLDPFPYRQYSRWFGESKITEVPMSPDMEGLMRPLLTLAGGQ